MLLIAGMFVGGFFVSVIHSSHMVGKATARSCEARFSLGPRPHAGTPVTWLNKKPLKSFRAVRRSASKWHAASKINEVRKKGSSGNGVGFFTGASWSPPGEGVGSAA